MSVNSTFLIFLNISFLELFHFLLLDKLDLKFQYLFLFQVKACRKLESTDPPNATLCSEYAMITARTLHLEGADMVYFRKADVEDANTTLAGSSSGSSHNLGRVRLSWDPPKEPNGPILSYQVDA